MIKVQTVLSELRERIEESEDETERLDGRISALQGVVEKLLIALGEGTSHIGKTLVEQSEVIEDV